MERDWLSFRLLRPAGFDHDDHTARAVADVVPALVRHMRSADAEGRWHLGRTGGEPHGCLEVSFHSTPAVIDELEHRLHAQSAKHDWPMSLIPTAPAGSRFRAGSDVAAHLAAASSDFALDLLASGLTERDHLPAAVLHLRFVSDLLPAAERTAFLFHGWQLWSRPLSPDQRMDLVEQSGQLGHLTGLLAPTQWRADWREPWARHLRVLSSIVDTHAAAVGGALTYLLFEHAHLTHNRLGIPVAVEAVAARALRTALIDSAARELATLPVPQPA